VSARRIAERRAARLLPWLVTIACFAYLYRRIGASGGGAPPWVVLAHIFEGVDWLAWLALMVPYSFAYLLIDTAVLWRVVGWFNARVAFRDLLPVRASAYILSIVNEQVGKGAIAVYLNRREGVPGWQVGSSMLFIMFCEFYYLLSWALLGCILRWRVLPAVFHWIPVVAAAALVFFGLFVAFFRSRRLAHLRVRSRDLLLAFREARPWQYGVVILIRSPALLIAVGVYHQAAHLFGVSISLADMLGVLPVIFFGTLIPGPFRAVAVTLWPTLFPDHAARMTAFGLAQHNFFVLFNAAIGLVYLRRANRDLFEAGSTASS
jgi:hypothetical protein